MINDHWKNIYLMRDDELIVARCSYCGERQFAHSLEDLESKICPYCKRTGVKDIG